MTVDLLNRIISILKHHMYPSVVYLEVCAQACWKTIYAVEHQQYLSRKDMMQNICWWSRFFQWSTACKNLDGGNHPSDIHPSDIRCPFLPKTSGAKPDVIRPHVPLLSSLTTEQLTSSHSRLIYTSFVAFLLYPPPRLEPLHGGLPVSAEQLSVV